MADERLPDPNAQEKALLPRKAKEAIDVVDDTRAAGAPRIDALQEATFQNAEMLDNLREEAARKQALDAANTVMTTNQNAKDLVQNAAQNVPGATQAQKDALKRTNVTDAIDQSEKDKEDGVPPSPKNGFMSALALFLPTMIGGLAGAALEGSAGLAAGLQGGMKGTEAVIGMDKTLAETEAIRSKAKGGGISVKHQQTEFTDKNGNPIVFNPSSRQFVKADGTVANPGDFRDPKDVRHAQNLQRRDQTIRLSELKLRHNINKDAQLSDGQVKRFEEMDSVARSIDRIDELQDKVATGMGIGRFQSLQQFADAAPKEFTQMRSETTAVLANYVKSISGAQVSVQEAERLATVIPSVNDAPGVFEMKLKTFKTIVNSNKAAFKRAVLSGQPLKAGTIKGLEAAEKAVAGLPKSEPKPKGRLSGLTKEQRKEQYLKMKEAK